eukprot:3771187-Pleurochrysis_carterae.AAC.1
MAARSSSLLPPGQRSRPSLRPTLIPIEPARGRPRLPWPAVQPQLGQTEDRKLRVHMRPRAGRRGGAAGGRRVRRVDDDLRNACRRQHGVVEGDAREVVDVD